MYQMARFNNVHIRFLGIALIISLGLLIIAIPFRKKQYGKFLGYTILGFKALDMLFRVFVEKYRPISLVLPFHMCNIAVIVAGIYLITANKYLYAVIYTWVFGAVIVMFEPSNFTFISATYGVLFFLTHTTIILAVIYGNIYYKSKLSFKTYIFSLVFFMLAILNAYICNELLATNFFYLHDFVLPFLANIFSLRTYRILYILLNMLGITIMYLLAGIKNKRK